MKLMPNNKILEKNSTKIVFVQKDLKKWKKLTDLKNVTELEKALVHLDSGVDCWIFQTYVFLLKAGVNVEIVDYFIPNALCIAHFDNLLTPPPSSAYVVSVKGDRDRTFTCQSEIIQSPYSKEHSLNYFIPHWPQPNLTIRDVNRGTTIKTLGYFGLKKYIPHRFRTPEFIEGLKAMGIKFIVKEQYPDWADYSNVDVVFAIRDGSPYYLASKPASKLVNAWFAGCPALLGQEPVFNYYKKSDLDFIQTTSVEDVLCALRKLVAEPDLYQAMIDNGSGRLCEVNHNAITQIWIDTFTNEIIPDYHKWLKKSAINKSISSYIQRIRKFVRGHLYDVGFDQSTGYPMDRTSRLRKGLWLLFDSYARREYQARKTFFKKLGN